MVGTEFQKQGRLKKRVVSALSIAFLFIYPLLSLATEPPIRVGAERVELYLPLISGKRVGVVCNHTSRVDGCLLPDTLRSLGCDVVRLYTPEHGLRGMASAGEAVKSGQDAELGVEVVSLYGNGKKPTPQQLEGVEVMLFDLQDVGVRCYTYLSTLHYVEEACAEQGIPLLVLDRPNPNDYQVEGPVLDTAYRSFVGMHPIAWQHGMTLGELAMLIQREYMRLPLGHGAITVIPCENYWHGRKYAPPVPPSPNLPNLRAIHLYATLAFLEGTALSCGRGTDWPFQVAGHPSIEGMDFSFTPEARQGAKHPPYEGERCYGLDLRRVEIDSLRVNPGLQIGYLQTLRAHYRGKEPFFTRFFAKLAGTASLEEGLLAGEDWATLRRRWRGELKDFLVKREEYLLYADSARVGL